MRFRHDGPSGDRVPHRFIVLDNRRSTGHEIEAFMALASEWCDEAFGIAHARHPTFTPRWMRVGWTVYVYREDDALAFKLRWC